MNRATPIILVALGTILFGIALGLVYIDDRALRIRELDLLESKLTMSPSGPPSTQPPPETVSKIPPIGAPVVAAMAIGPLGAGLALAGLLMLVLDLPWFRRPSTSPNPEAR